jgi:AhpC/TSA family
MKEIFWSSYVILWVVVAIQGLAFVEVLRQQAALRRRVGPDQGASLMPGSVETGALLPELDGWDLVTGAPTAWSRYLQHEIGIAAFVTPRCPKCHEVAEGLAQLWPNVQGEVDVVAIVHGQKADVLKLVEETGLPSAITVVDEAGTIAEKLGISVTPSAITIRDRRVGVAAIVNDGHQLEWLLEREKTKPSVVHEDEVALAQTTAV